MSRILLLDATFKKFAVGVAEHSKLLENHYPILFKDLSECVLSCEPFDKILVNIGPGSFTGIRSSLSFVLGFRNLQKAGLSVLELAAKDLPNGEAFLQCETQKRGALADHSGVKDFDLSDQATLKGYNKINMLKEGLSGLANSRPVADWQGMALQLMAEMSDVIEYTHEPLKPLYLRKSAAEEQALSRRNPIN